jgi:hypothetical protein
LIATASRFEPDEQRRRTLDGLAQGFADALAELRKLE